MLRVDAIDSGISLPSWNNRSTSSRVSSVIIRLASSCDGRSSSLGPPPPSFEGAFPLPSPPSPEGDATTSSPDVIDLRDGSGGGGIGKEVATLSEGAFGLLGKEGTLATLVTVRIMEKRVLTVSQQVPIDGSLFQLMVYFQIVAEMNPQINKILFLQPQ